MKNILKNRAFKVIVSVIALLALGCVIAALGGRSETAQSTVVGTVFAPCHYVAQKISNGVDKIFGEVSGNSAYEKEIESLRNQIGELQAELVDYENLKNQIIIL